MPNWDLYCTQCGDVGSYLDFPVARVYDPMGEVPRPSITAADPDERECLFCIETGDDNGRTVAWRDDD